ncbi:Ltp family lipoprotein, partial [Trueperella sp.]|uniref:Ltp family lipoprotein n=1 Tax=Trueperella sp. TaxID=2699835 RepID=UPI0037352740
FSKASLHRLLTSEYGYGFSTEAADYALENVDVDWNEQALKAAEEYRDVYDVEGDELYDMLISEYDGKFTEEQAQYAMDNLS